MSTRRVVLASITARLLWDGRAEAKRFIPGIAHFQSGVVALRRAGDSAATERLAEIDAALSAAEDAVNRWARGVAAFARDELADATPDTPGWADAEERGLRIRAGEAVRLATLIAAFDATCAATSAVTALVRERGVFNPHHACIADRAGMIRHIADLGHAGGCACRTRRGGAGTAGRTARRRGEASAVSVGIRAFCLRYRGAGGSKGGA